jgi:hypothetical protein
MLRAFWVRNGPRSLPSLPPFFFGNMSIAKAPYYRHKTAAAASMKFVSAIATQGFPGPHC